jgi:signal transduction histidine kinase
MAVTLPLNGQAGKSQFACGSPLGQEGGEDARLGREMFLSTELGHHQVARFVLAALAVAGMTFIAVAPFAKTPLLQVPAFIPIYESALVICDLITAILLFSQFSFLRSKALFVLASGYLFTAFMTVLHALTFPGLFSSTGLLGAGPQSTAWTYVLWHGGFPLVVIAYAMLRDGGTDAIATASLTRGRYVVSILVSAAAALTVVCIASLFATAGQASLPTIMQGNRISLQGQVILSSTWVLSLVALIVLWRRRPHTVLDMWLMVVMFTWLFDIALSGILNGARYDLGWYAGRIYGLLAATFVLAVLLLENGKHYSRLVLMSSTLSATNKALERKVAELDHSNEELRQFAYVASHDLQEPLRMVASFTQLLAKRYRGKLDADADEYIAFAVDGATRMQRLIQDLLAYSSIGTKGKELREISSEAALGVALTNLRGAIEECGARVTHDPLPAVLADDTQLVQLLQNLVGNAIKYRRAAVPEIHISAARDRGQKWIFSVRDNGLGIDAQYFGRIFTMFQRLHTRDEFSGTGIGLAICKKIVERHGSSISVESQLGMGSTFRFALAESERTS